MDVFSDISDEEFVLFLQSLGVESYKKSFEWMLNDADFAGVLRWLYKNLDHNNALSAREEYRYNEIQKNDHLLSSEELDTAVSAIQEQFPGICLPGNLDGISDVKLDISMLKERLNMLEKQEDRLQNLVSQNELLKDELTLETSKVNAATQQLVEDESTAAEECISLANSVEYMTDEVIDVITDALELYEKTGVDKNTAKKFFTFGPFESYRQSQALFRSHFDLYTSKKFSKKQCANCSDEELAAILMDAKIFEERLRAAAMAYIESKAELSGEQAKLALVVKNESVHQSEIVAGTMEAQSALELLDQEQSIVERQIQNVVDQFVEKRTRLAVDVTTKAALMVREQVNTELTNLVDLCQRAASLDRALYLTLRQELRCAEQLLHFASQLNEYVVEETAATVTRIEAMNEITEEQQSCIQQLAVRDPLLQILAKVFQIESFENATTFGMLYKDLQNTVTDMREKIQEQYKRKEQELFALNLSTKPLLEYVFDGCTKQANCHDRTIASLTHTLIQDMEASDNKVSEASSQFAAVKNGDKKCLRKLWQWFLTDPSKLMGALKNASCS